MLDLQGKSHSLPTTAAKLILLMTGHLGIGQCKQLRAWSNLGDVDACRTSFGQVKTSCVLTQGDGKQECSLQG